MGTAIAKTAITIGGDTQELEAALAKAGASLKNMVSTAIGVLATSLSVKWGYDLLKQSQSAQLAMEQVVGSADEVKNILKGLKSEGGNDAGIFGKSYRQLKLFGFAAEDIPGILRIVGDAAAMMPEGVEAGMDTLIGQLGIMKDAGKVTEKQLKSLAMNGIDAYQMLQKFGGFDTVGQVKGGIEERGYRLWRCDPGDPDGHGREVRRVQEEERRGNDRRPDEDHVQAVGQGDAGFR